MKSNRWRLAVVTCVFALTLAATWVFGAAKSANAVQDLPVDSIYVTDVGKGVRASKNTGLGFDLDNRVVFYGFKWTVTRASDDAMENSTVKQEFFRLGIFKEVKEVDGQVKTVYSYLAKDKTHPNGAELKKEEWERIYQKWEQNDYAAFLVVDVSKDGEKADGRPRDVEKDYKSSALDGKQFTLADFPGYRRLNDRTLVELKFYDAFRVSSKLTGGTDISADFKLHLAVAKEGGDWVKKAAKTYPTLPQTWPKK